MNNYKSPDEIVEEEFATLHKDSIKAILEDCPTDEDMVRYHHTVGQSIRNKYDLWDPDNPYTETKNPIIEGGIVTDPKFPDQVSHEILKKLWHKVKEAYGS